jgi:hypothetical protein
MQHPAAKPRPFDLLMIGPPGTGEIVSVAPVHSDVLTGEAGSVDHPTRMSAGRGEVASLRFAHWPTDALPR